MKQCWIITDGMVGKVNQCLGLAEALGYSLDYETKDSTIKPHHLSNSSLPGSIKLITVTPNWPWTVLPSRFWPMPLSHAAVGSLAKIIHHIRHHHEQEWPSLVLCCGRSAAAPAAAIRRITQRQQQHTKTRVIAVQDPRLPVSQFDLIVVASHDRLRGENVIVTEGALNRVTAANLASGRAKFAPQWQNLPRPLVGVLLGGANARFQFGAKEALSLANDLVRLSRQDFGLVITPSRRTAPWIIGTIKSALSVVPQDRYYIWDGNGDNPYFAVLGSADHIIVTSDSVSMASEAASTGVPLSIFQLAGSAGKFGAFHQRLFDLAIARPWLGEIAAWNYTPLRDADLAAKIVLERLD